MEGTINRIIWAQFGAAIDMLRNTIDACPDHLWRYRMWRDGEIEVEYSEIWNVIYHTLFWLDLYLSGSSNGFAPPAPFGLDELDPRGLLPKRPFTKKELISYVQHCRHKCQAIFEDLSDDEANRICAFPWGHVSFLELQLYNMRHVQEHAAQIALLLGREVGSAPGWVTRVSSGSDSS